MGIERWLGTIGRPQAALAVATKLGNRKIRRKEMEQYLINPVNPMVTLRHKPWVQKAFRRSADGRFGPLPKAAKKRKGITTKVWTRKRKAASAKRSGPIAIVKRRKNPMSPLMLVNKKRRKSAKRQKSMVMMNTPRRTRRAVRRFRRNPMQMPKLEGISQLVMTGALVVAGAAGGGFLIGTLSKNFPTLQKPMVKIGAYIGAGALAYYLLKQTKMVKGETAAMIAAGIMVPALMDVRAMIMPRLGTSVPQQVSYEGRELSAFVPNGNAGMGAYVPNESLSAGGYGDSY